MKVFMLVAITTTKDNEVDMVVSDTKNALESVLVHEQGDWHASRIDVKLLEVK